MSEWAAGGRAPKPEGMATPDPIAPGLMTGDQPPRLLGGRCRETGRLVFPRPPGDTHDPVALSPRGRVWSWTVQRFRPKSPPYAGPEAFEPFVFAYVELPELIVAARLVDVAPDQLRVGLPVAFAPAPMARAGGGAALVPAFRPDPPA
jgi:hypothetical protein